MWIEILEIGYVNPFKQSRLARALWIEIKPNTFLLLMYGVEARESLVD